MKSDAKVVPFARGQSAADRSALEALFKSDLEKSGISLAMARKLGFRVVTPDQAWDLLYPKRAGDRDSKFTAYGYWIPYFRCDGTPSDYGRVRKLVGNFLNDDDGKDRYRSPVNTLPHLYVPVPLLNARSEDRQV
jgi:hypothetical protein